MHANTMLRHICGGQPNGQPIYSYRLTPESVEEIAQLLQRSSRQGRLRSPADSECALFCIYASEWYRRKRFGGSWSWGPVTQALDVDATQADLRNWVQRGMRLLQREVHQRSDGTQQFLFTLACEGGLPLQRLAVEGARIRSFFRALLEHFSAMERTGHEEAHILTRDAAQFQHHLAQSFRNEVVFRFAGELVGGVWRLKRSCTGDGDPVEQLDLVHPGWRDQLPLVASDGVAETLLRDLVLDTETVLRGGSFRFEVQTELHTTGTEGPSLFRVLAAPVSIRHDQLRDQFPGLPEEVFARRLRIQLATDTGARSIAGVLRRSGDEWLYTPHRGRGLHGAGVQQTVHIELVSSRSGVVRATGALGCGALGDLPWVFRERCDGSLALIATGSARHRDPLLWVAMPAAASIQGDAQSSQTKVDGRVLYSVSGTATVSHPDGPVRITAGAAQADAEMFDLVGPTLRGVDARHPIFLGPPTLRRRRGPQIVPEVHTDEGWVPLTPAHTGRQSLRVVEDGVLRFRQRVDIVPADTSITIEQVGATGIAARLRVQGVEELGVTGEGVHVVSTRDAEGCLVSLRSDSPPARLALRLMLPSGVVDASMVYPATCVRFVDLDGAPVGEAPLHLRDLSRLTAVGVSSDAHTAMSVQISVHTRKGLHPHPVTRMLHQQGHTWVLPLLEVRETVARLLDMTTDLDATVLLRLQAHGRSMPGSATLRVRRYDWTLEAHESGDVELDTMPSDAERAHLSAVARPFADIATAIPLPRVRSVLRQRPTWAFEPELKDPGSYLVLVESDGWHRCRVLPIRGGHGNPPSEGLAGALQHTTRAPRRAAIRVCLDAMAAEADHADWPLLMAYLDLLGELPAAVFDVLIELVEHPDAVALTGLKLAALPSAALDTGWQGLQQLLFLWEAIPMDSWFKAFDRIFDQQSQGLPQHAATELSRRVATLAESLPTLPMFLAHWGERSQVPVEVDHDARATLTPVSHLFLEMRNEILKEARHRHQEGVRGPWPTLQEGSLTVPLPWQHPIPTPFSAMSQAFDAPTALALAVVEGRTLPAAITLYLEELDVFDDRLLGEALTLSTAAILARQQE